MKAPAIGRGRAVRCSTAWSCSIRRPAAAQRLFGAANPRDRPLHHARTYSRRLVYQFCGRFRARALPGTWCSAIGRRIADERMQAFGAFAATELRRGKLGATAWAPMPGHLRTMPTLSQAHAQAPPLGDVLAERHSSDGGAAQGRITPQASTWRRKAATTTKATTTTTSATSWSSTRRAGHHRCGRRDLTAKTFSRQRYEIWTMQSAYHNLRRPSTASCSTTAASSKRAMCTTARTPAPRS